MSVTFIENDRISQVAHFAQSVGLGSAALVGQLIHELNVKCYNERYNEDEKPCFTLEDVEPKTQDHIYDLTRYIKGNSYPTGYKSSKAYKLLIDIESKAASSVGGSFDDLIGTRVYGNNRHLKDCFIGQIISPTQCTIIYFLNDEMKWGSTYIPLKHLKAYPSEGNDFNLTKEQAEDILSRIKNAQQEAIEKREAEIEKQRIIQEAFDKEFQTIIPEGSKAVIVAELHEDDCGDNNDYYGSIVTRRIVLAFSKHTKRLFPEMRKAALNFELTEHLNDKEQSKEHRENYSMGGGTFLSSGSSYKGWQIKKEYISQHSSINKGELLDIDYSKPAGTKNNKAINTTISKNDINRSWGDMTNNTTTKQSTTITKDEEKTNTLPECKNKTLNINTADKTNQQNIVSLNLVHARLTIDTPNNSITIKPNFNLAHSTTQQLKKVGYSLNSDGVSWTANTSQKAIERARNIATNGAARTLF